MCTTFVLISTICIITIANILYLEATIDLRSYKENAHNNHALNDILLERINERGGDFSAIKFEP